MDETTHCIAFLRFCINNHQPVPSTLDGFTWKGLASFMKEQALLGIGFLGIKKLKEAGVEVPKKVLVKWYAVADQTERRNQEVNERTGEVVKLLREKGFQCCVLKGQGNAQMYPWPSLRTSGDIDVWVSGSRKAIMAFAKKDYPHADVRFHHVEYPVFDDTDVELHFTPAIMNNPWYNRRLQRWFSERKDEQFNHTIEMPDEVGNIPVPTMEFNLVYQLVHMMHHFFDEGIGLRQMMDYFFLLKTTNCTNYTNFNNHTESTDLRDTLRYLGLRKFAGAVMYVMRVVFGLEGKDMIVEPDEWRGKLLLEEILKGGNFGKHSGLTNHSAGTKYFLKIKRNMRFVCTYPAEALCEPWFRTWHFFWRISHR